MSATDAGAPLPRLGTFKYDVEISRESTVRTVGRDGVPGDPKVLTEEDSYTETQRNERLDSGTVRQHTKTPTGPGGWRDLRSVDGGLHEVATASERVSDCVWDPPLLLVPADPVQDGAAWTTTTTCTYKHDKGPEQRRNRVVTAKLIGRERFSLGRDSFDGLRIERRVEELSEGGSKSTTTTVLLFLPVLMMAAEEDTTFEHVASNVVAKNQVSKRLTEVDLNS